MTGPAFPQARTAMRPSSCRCIAGTAALVALLPAGCDTPSETEDCYGSYLCESEYRPTEDQWLIVPHPRLAMGDTVQFEATFHQAGSTEESDGPFTWAADDTVLLAMDQGLAIGRIPGHTFVEVVHVPTQDARLFGFEVQVGDAPTDTVSFKRLDGNCGLDTEGAVLCWGHLNLGLGYHASSRSTATPVLGGHSFTTVAQTGSRACGLVGNGELLCWGVNHEGLLGTGDSEAVLEPTPVAAAPALSSVHVGVDEVCGITAEHRAYCWGRLVDTTSVQPIQLPDTVTWAALAPADSANTCGLDTDGVAYCWGLNNRGQLGDGTRTDRLSPAPVAGERRYQAIAAVRHGTSCALDLDGYLYCWGPVPGSGEDRLEPTAVAPGQQFQELRSSVEQLCALGTDGTPYCWGQVWSPDAFFYWWPPCGTVLVAEPSPVATDRTFTSVAPGEGFSCALTEDGTAACWGCNAAGQLGTGTLQDAEAPSLPVIRLR